MRKNVSYGHDTIGHVCTRCGLHVPDPRPLKCVCGAKVPRSDEELERNAKPFPWQYVWGPLGLALAVGVAWFVTNLLGIW